jgi:hypothetical protein
MMPPTYLEWLVVILLRSWRSVCYFKIEKEKRKNRKENTMPFGIN